MINKDQFVQNLVSDLKADRQWPPLGRTLLWISLALLLNAGVMLWVQDYRPDFMSQLVQYKRFFIEIISAFIFTVFLSYWVLNSLVPGNKLSKGYKLLGLISFLVFLISIATSFNVHSPPASRLGSRPYCVEEVVVYGLIGMFSFLFFLRKSYFQIPKSKLMLMGATATLVPGIIMQLSCMYSPLHGLLLHYGPILLVSVFGLSLSKFQNVFRG